MPLSEEITWCQSSLSRYLQLVTELRVVHAGRHFLLELLDLLIELRDDLDVATWNIGTS